MQFSPYIDGYGMSNLKYTYLRFFPSGGGQKYFRSKRGANFFIAFLLTNFSTISDFCLKIFKNSYKFRTVLLQGYSLKRLQYKKGYI